MNLEAKREFLISERAWVRIVRKTTDPKRLHLVEPALERERAINAELESIEAALSVKTEPVGA